MATRLEASEGAGPGPARVSEAAATHSSQALNIEASEAEPPATDREASASAPVAGLPGAGRRGPSGQSLKGPEQKTHVIEAPPSASANPLQTPAIEAENVHRVYNDIAEHWNHTRYKAWPRVDAFIRSRPPGSLVADLGCGNGKNIPAIRESGGFPIASDISEPLARIAAETHGVSTLVADCLCAPFRSGIFDAAISIAVLHHLSTVPRRVQALREAARLLRPNGELLVYCWSFEQDERSRSRHRFAGQDVLVPWHYRTPTVRKSARGGQATGNASRVGDTAEGFGALTATASSDATSQSPATSEAPAATANGGNESWTDTPTVRQRYCHVYRDGELQELLAEVPELEMQDCYFDTGNWCAIARRRRPDE